MTAFQTKPDVRDGSYVRVMNSVSRGHGTVLLDAIENDDNCTGAYLDPDNAFALAKHLLSGLGYVVIKSEDAADAAFTLRSIEHKGSSIYDDLASRIEGI